MKKNYTISGLRFAAIILLLHLFSIQNSYAANETINSETPGGISAALNRMNTEVIITLPTGQGIYIIQSGNRTVKIVFSGLQ